MQVTVIGVNKLKKRLNMHGLTAFPLRRYFDLYGAIVADKSKEIAPEDMGDLKKGIGHKRIPDRGRLPKGVDIYSRAPHSTYVHGFANKSYRLTPPYSRSKPHYPPIKALEGWAKRHDINPYVVQQAIGKKGTPIIPFIKIAIRETVTERNALLREAGKAITVIWRSGRMRAR